MNISVTRCLSVAAILLLLLPLVGCHRRESKISVDLTYLEDGISSGEWAVITEPYAAFRERPDPSSNVAAHGRLGDIAQVTGKSLIPDSKGTSTVIWYQFDSGYVPESSVVIYSNQLKAQTASAELQKNDR